MVNTAGSMLFAVSVNLKQKIAYFPNAAFSQVIFYGYSRSVGTAATKMVLIKC